MSSLLISRRIPRGRSGTLLRRPGQPDQPPPDQQPGPNPEEVLAERLARGEIDPDEYRQRLQTLQETINRT